MNFDPLFADSTIHALELGSKDLVIGARGGTVSEDAVLARFMLEEVSFHGNADNSGNHKIVCLYVHLAPQFVKSLEYRI